MLYMIFHALRKCFQNRFISFNLNLGGLSFIVCNILYFKAYLGYLFTKFFVVRLILHKHCKIPLFSRQENVNAKWVSPALNVKRNVLQIVGEKLARTLATVLLVPSVILEMEIALKNAHQDLPGPIVIKVCKLSLFKKEQIISHSLELVSPSE